MPFKYEMSVKELKRVALKSIVYMQDDWVKLFEPPSSRSGGYLYGVCPHGVVYISKVLTTHESPRDIVDMVLSLKCVLHAFCFSSAL